MVRLLEIRLTTVCALPAFTVGGCGRGGRRQCAFPGERKRKMKNTMTLRQLRAILPSTKGQPIPTKEWLRANAKGEAVFYSTRLAYGGLLIIFKNGFYYYKSLGMATVLRVDGFSKVYVETDDDGHYEKRAEETYIDKPFLDGLGLNALWQLKRNQAQRRCERSEMPTDSEILNQQRDQAVPDILDQIVEKETRREEIDLIRRGWALLSKEQQEAVYLHFWKDLSRAQIAEQLGISARAVSYRIEGAIEVFKKIKKVLKSDFPNC